MFPSSAHRAEEHRQHQEIWQHLHFKRSFQTSQLSLERLVTGLVIIYVCIAPICLASVDISVDIINLQTQNSPDLAPKFRGLLSVHTSMSTAPLGAPQDMSVRDQQDCNLLFNDVSERFFSSFILLSADVIEQLQRKMSVDALRQKKVRARRRR